MSGEVLQSKGGFSFAYGTYIAKNVADSAISYDIGDVGDVLSSVDAVVHLRRNKNSIISTVTITLVKGGKDLNNLLVLVGLDTPFPMVINDPNLKVKLVFESASATQIQISDTTGGNDIETISFAFKGNLKLLEL